MSLGDQTEQLILKNLTQSELNKERSPESAKWQLDSLQPTSDKIYKAQF